MRKNDPDAPKGARIIFVFGADCRSLGAQTHAALQGEGLTGEVLEVGVGELDADPADLRLGVAVVAHGGIFTLALKASG